eukprot:CAMPEP_0184491176 /NCGR_PEP_ID=MMETSP0113_2-20130426/19761_1 /TAXON_ID=91329 /ORGANISM="Norrisiella sphaerica, Strain BC52" /LENGTH=242 /DNA_ID=CAMNT_0026875431 /DNA_START=60 /DNA_END=785 /DNA_ORIENTATION=+
MNLRVFLIVAIAGFSTAYDCCTGHLCNENWDQYDSATGNCCMLPGGGKMIEQTNIGSCSCPSLQQCDFGPKATSTHPTDSIKKHRVVEKKPHRYEEAPFEYVLLGCIVMLVFMMTVILCLGLWRVRDGYDRLATRIDRAALPPNPYYQPYPPHGGYYPSHLQIGRGPQSDQKRLLQDEAKRNSSINRVPAVPAYYHQSYQNRDMIGMMNYINEFQRHMQHSQHARLESDAEQRQQDEANRKI